MKAENKPIGAYALLEWVRTPQNHGGTNPYVRDDVIEAERAVAKFEGREVESFAADWSKKGKGKL